MGAFDLESGPARLACTVHCQKGVYLLREHAMLDGREELFGFNKGQAPVLDALGVLLQGDNVGYGFFTALIGAQDKLKFDAHGEAPPGLNGGCMMQVILPEFVAYPQHLHALQEVRTFLDFFHRGTVRMFDVLPETTQFLQ
jgi:hypothetical protein